MEMNDALSWPFLMYVLTSAPVGSVLAWNVNHHRAVCEWNERIVVQCGVVLEHAEHD